MRNIILLASGYIFLFLILVYFGIIGDTSKKSMEYALKFFSAEEIATGKDCFTFRLIPHAIYRVISIIFLLVITANGYHKKIIQKLFRKSRFKKILPFLSFLVLFIALEILRFPFSYFSSFYAGKRFGILNADFITWLFRYFASSGIFILFISSMLTIVTTIIIRTKRYFIYIPVALFFAGIAVTIIYPRIITPVFYKMEKLHHGELREKINGMLAKSDMTVNEIYVIDSSRISEAVNAYMTGFGGDKKIVLYDTLIKNYNSDEILSVVAHEICHYREEHVLTGITIASASLFLLLPLLNFFLKITGAGNLKAISKPENHTLFIILLIIVLFISKPVRNGISRTLERRADYYSIALTGNPLSFIEIKRKMAEENKTHLLPHKIYSWFYYTHPPVLERIKSAEKYLEKHPDF